MDLGGWTAVASGVGVAAVCGLRAFLPLLLLGLAGRADWIELAPGATWLASDRALIALAVATVLEVAGDKIPVVDHALDAVGLALRPAAAWLAGFALLGGWPAPWPQLFSLVLAGGALGVQAAKAKLRVGSSAATLGHGNPILSVFEDGAALVGTVVALLVPLLALAVVVLVLFALLRWRRRPATA